MKQLKKVLSWTLGLKNKGQPKEKKKKTFWAKCNIFGLNQKRIKQKKQEERVAELKQKRLGWKAEKRLGFLGCVRLQQVKGWTLKR